jgi:hypothetical protein
MCDFAGARHFGCRGQSWGPLATSPVTALPGSFGQGVLIDEPAGVMEFGANPLPSYASVSGAPVTTLDVRISGNHHFRLHHERGVAVYDDGRFTADDRCVESVGRRLQYRGHSLLAGSDLPLVRS